MKILIVNRSDLDGGAARAAYRLHKALLDNEINSQMLVQYKSSDDHTVIDSSTKIQKFLGKLRPTLDSLPTKFFKHKSKMLFSPSWLPFSNIVNKINEINPDIVHIHWICSGMIRIEDIAKIKAPIIWSLHDMWAFTDGYHYDESFDICKNGCINEPKNFLSKNILKRKEKTYNTKKNMTIVGLSKWLNECSKKSSLLKNKKHYNLPNPINTKIFKPFNKKEARNLWNLPQNKKLILFGAMGATSDPRKGFNELSKAMNQLNEDNNIEFIVYGSSKPKNDPHFKFKTNYLGRLTDDISLITLYSAADLMVVPSLQENLSNAIMESLACGTPVLAFNIGGNIDMIKHMENGYLAEPFNTSDLKNGIEWIIKNDNYNNISNNARKTVLNKFDSKLIAKQYLSLYKEVLNEL